MDVLSFLTDYLENLTIVDLISVLLLLTATTAYTLGELWSHRKLKWLYVAESTGYWGERSHERKYAQPRAFAPDSWYYRWAGIRWKERFPGAATIFVGLTDGYHASQTIFLFCFSLIPALHTEYPVTTFLVYRTLIGISFSIIYRKYGI